MIFAPDQSDRCSRFRIGPFRRDRRPRQDGAALILTLGILALLILLVVSYLGLAATESRATRGYAAGQTVKRLSDSVAQLVMSQLREATAGFAKDGSGHLDPSSPLTWATQPGMVHTFDTSGSPDRIFKLYSSEEMVVSRSSAAPPDEASDLDGWEDQPGVFTDLNSPVMIPGGRGGSLTPQSPIIDIDGLVEGNRLTPPVAGLTYSSDGTRPDIEGFSIVPPPSYRPGDPISPTNNPAPMPVRWLYVLEDGRLTAPRHNAGDGTAVFDLPGQVAPTADNPIVARVAFWTDDECAKVNVNTASEGVYWDMPRTYSLQDVGQYNGSSQIPLHGGLSICQPAQKEFQRYPGHPATTSLSPVLGSILPLPPEPVTNRNAGAFDAYYHLTPRTNVGGSQSGTAIPSDTLEVRSDRLFPSVSDFLFSKDVVGRRGDPNRYREVNGALTPGVVRRSEFFLSAHSKAPETNLFNAPRIAIWPIWEEPSKRTAYDKLAAFCSTIGDRPYYFARKNPRSGTDDFTGRNQELYGWLQRLTGAEIPGYGGDFASKYGADRDQILTCVFDYVRSTNTQDRSAGAVPFTPIFNSVGGSPRGAGEVVPIRIGNTQGFGRFPALSEPGIMFVGTAGEKARATGMEAVFVAEFFSPGHGMACVRHDMKFRVTGLDKMRVRFGDGEWESLNLPASGDCYIEQTDLTYWGGRGVGGTTGLPMIFQPKNFTTSGGTSRGNFPFFSSTPITIPDDGTIETMEFDGGDELVLEMRTGDTDELVQTSRFEFPDGEFKIPGFGVNIRSRNKGGPWDYPRPEDTFVTLEAAGIAGNAPEAGTDPTAGDVRMLAGLRDVPATRFRAHNKYAEKGVQFAHSTKTASGRSAINGTSHGQLIPVLSYECMRSGGTTYDRNPDVPSRVGNAVKRVDGMPGEWDTGFGDQPDGPYINKPNEGDTSYFNRQGSAYRAPYILGHNQGFISADQVFFSPNLQIPSPLMFGSLPTGVVRNRPWETLLFHPRPEDPNHPGRATPHDHLLADLFWMPVIEPYAISQPFATAGKVNLNYRIQPFDYIRRETGVRAVMKGTKFLALHPTDSTKYKPLDPAQHGIPFAPDRRLPIDPAATLSEFDSRYESAGVFRSPGEICEMHLVPPGETASGMRAFWETYSLSGDNVREKPYVDIYPRVTTRSNSFTIHYKVQVLRQARSTPSDVWDPARDAIVAEERGATVFERHIDPNDPRLPDFATLPAGSPDAVIDRYYRFRVLSSKIFKPGPAR